jgi:hypothetical protein
MRSIAFRILLLRFDLNGWWKSGFAAMGGRFMMLGPMKSSISKKELEHWLMQVFVPVEPDDVFVRRLKARLLKYHGDKVFSVWMVIGVMAMVIMFILTWLGFLLRILLLITSLFVDRRKHAPQEKKLSAASG